MTMSDIKMTHKYFNYHRELERLLEDNNLQDFKELLDTAVADGFSPDYVTPSLMENAYLHYSGPKWDFVLALIEKGSDLNSIQYYSSPFVFHVFRPYNTGLYSKMPEVFETWVKTTKNINCVDPKDNLTLLGKYIDVYIKTGSRNLFPYIDILLKNGADPYLSKEWLNTKHKCKEENQRMLNLRKYINRFYLDGSLEDAGTTYEYEI